MSSTAEFSYAPEFYRVSDGTTIKGVEYVFLSRPHQLMRLRATFNSTADSDNAHMLISRDENDAIIAAGLTIEVVKTILSSESGRSREKHGELVKELSADGANHPLLVAAALVLGCTPELIRSVSLPDYLILFGYLRFVESPNPKGLLGYLPSMKMAYNDGKTAAYIRAGVSDYHFIVECIESGIDPELALAMEASGV